MFDCCCCAGKRIFHHVRDERITTLVCELAALCIRCKRRRLREVVASRFNLDLTGVSACCIQDHHFDERFVSVLRGVVRFNRDC